MAVWPPWFAGGSKAADRQAKLGTNAASRLRHMRGPHPGWHEDGRLISTEVWPSRPIADLSAVMFLTFIDTIMTQV
jgi:hypothetical protein